MARSASAPSRAIPVLLGLMPLASGAVALWLGQDIGWDFRNYHWYNAYAFLTGRTASGIDLAPAQGQTYFNPLLDLPLYMLGTHLSARLAAFVMACVQGLNVIPLYLLARHALVIPGARRKQAACFLLAVLGMTGSAALGETGTAFNDNLTSLGIFTSALLVLGHSDSLLSQPWKKSAGLVFSAAFPQGSRWG